MPTAKKADIGLTALEEKKLDVAVESAKLDIAQKRADNSAQTEYYEGEGKKRYKCKITSMRRGEKQFELTVADPANPNHAILIREKCGVVLQQGLPMFAIDALRAAYDVEAEEVSVGADPNIHYQREFKTFHRPRYAVEVYGEVEDPKPLSSLVRY